MPLQISFWLSLLVIFLATPALTLTVAIPPSSLFCVFREISANREFTAEYVVSGYKDNSVTALVQSPNLMDVLHSSELGKEGGWQIHTKDSGEYRACFRNFATEEVFLTFEMTVREEELSLFLQTDSIHDFGAKLSETFEELKTITTNMNFQKVRDHVHNVNLENLDSKIQWSGFFKVLSLITVGIGQAYILTGILNAKAKRRFV